MIKMAILQTVGFDYLNQRVKEALVEFVSAVVREKFQHLSNEKVHVAFLSGRSVPCGHWPERRVKELREEAEWNLGSKICKLITNTGEPLQEHLTLEEAGINSRSNLTAVAWVPTDPDGRHHAAQEPASSASQLAEGSRKEEEGDNAYARLTAAVELDEEMGQMIVPFHESEADFEHLFRQKSQILERRVLNEDFQTGRFVKKIGLHPEEREYFDIELENTAICLVQDGILMMSSVFVHEANALKVEVLEDFDAPALPAGMSLNEELDVFEYIDVLSPEEVMWNLSISASDRVVAQLDQDGCGLHAEKLGTAMQMLGVSSTTMQASKASIDFLALHDLLLQELKKPATDLSNRLMELLDLLNGRKDTISLSELKRFLGIRAANRQAPAIPLEELRHKLLDPTRLQRLLNDGAFGRISWAVADRNAGFGPWCLSCGTTQPAVSSRGRLGRCSGSAALRGTAGRGVTSFLGLSRAVWRRERAKAHVQDAVDDFLCMLRLEPRLLGERSRHVFGAIWKDKKLRHCIGVGKAFQEVTQPNDPPAYEIAAIHDFKARQKDIQQCIIHGAFFLVSALLSGGIAGCGGNADLASFTVNGAFDSALGRFSCCLDEGSGEPKAEHATRTLTSEVEGSQN
eukprot:g31589.t1